MSNPICEHMERWLDEGRPRDGASAAEALELETHAATCARCRPALEAAVALESALRTPPAARAPAGLAAGVMARIAAENPVPRQPLAHDEPPVRSPSWTQVASDPWALAGAAGVLAVVAGRGRLDALARTLAAHAPEPSAWVPPSWLDKAASLDAALARWLEASAALAPHAQAAVALGVAAAAGAFAWLLFRFSEALFVRAVR